jgi:hypothetical protein
MARAVASALCALALGAGQPVSAAPRLAVLTDVGNEPDDQMSLVRLLLYSNDIDIEAIIAVTSVWQRDKLSPEIAEQVIDAYEQVRPNLELHALGWPSAATLKNTVSRGVPHYGLAAIDPDHPSPGALALLKLARTDDAEPLWIAAWGGTNTLAEALEHARRTQTAAELARIIARLRVYAISDQDDAGPWLRREFPGLFYIVSPSTPDGSDYARATWTGISGDRFYRNGEGADFTPVSNEWLDRNIRSKGPLGARYPRYMFIMEGDTPSFLGLIPTGLRAGDHPDWGGWGGRYLLRTPYGESRAIWTQGGDSFARITSADTIGSVTSDQATIWRWRAAFQNDFAARMDWTIKPFSAANHPPQPVVNGSIGIEPVRLALRVGETLRLAASGSRDPDGDQLHYSWFAYGEAGFGGGNFGTPQLRIVGADQSQASLIATASCSPNWLAMGDCPPLGEAHVILAITDSGKPALTRYRRIIVTVTQSGGSRP